MTTLPDRRREKRWKFERSVLRRLSLKEVRTAVEAHFRSVVPFYFLSHPFLLDPCMDMAIDAYLLGAAYGRFGYIGESDEEVLLRSEEELTDLSHYVFDLLQGWLIDSDFLLDSLKEASDEFVLTWWKKGFSEGERQHRLRMH